MININDTVQFIKRRLGYPTVSLELNDTDIEAIIKNESLQLFEQYVPDNNYISIPKGSKKYRVKKNLYWVIDPHDREVFYVQDVAPEMSELLANGYPYTTPIASYYNMPDLLDRMNMAHIGMQWGRTLRWWQPAGINQVWIFSEEGISGRYLVWYTRSHAPDLSSISREYAIDFTNICLAYTMMMIGQIRSKYGTLGTPVGDIQINNELYGQGQEILNATIEKLSKSQPIFTQIAIH